MSFYLIKHWECSVYERYGQKCMPFMLRIKLAKCNLFRYEALTIC